MSLYGFDASGQTNAFRLRLNKPFFMSSTETLTLYNVWLEWWNGRSNWDDDWIRVVISEESRFCPCVYHGNRRVKHRNSEFALERQVVVVRTITSSSSNTCNWQKFKWKRLHMKCTFALPYLPWLLNPLFQKDSERPLAVRINTTFLQDVDTASMTFSKSRLDSNRTHLGYDV